MLEYPSCPLGPYKLASPNLRPFPVAACSLSCFCPACCANSASFISSALPNKGSIIDSNKEPLLKDFNEGSVNNCLAVATPGIFAPACATAF